MRWDSREGREKHCEIQKEEEAARGAEGGRPCRQMETLLRRCRGLKRNEKFWVIEHQLSWKGGREPRDSLGLESPQAREHAAFPSISRKKAEGCLSRGYCC